MLDEICRRGSFKILASQSAASPDDISNLQSCFGNIPHEYLALVCESTEIELQHVGGQYVRIWGPTGCIEMNEGYGIGRRLPGAIPIGDDGGGRVIFYGDGHFGPGLYHLGYGNLDRDDAIWIAPSLRHFLIEAEGVESF